MYTFYKKHIPFLKKKTLVASNLNFLLWPLLFYWTESWTFCSFDPMEDEADPSMLRNIARAVPVIFYRFCLQGKCFQFYTFAI